MNENQAIATLKEAEAALDAGDVQSARELAETAQFSHAFIYVPNGDALAERAVRVRALSVVRDRGASPAELEAAVTLLEQQISSTNHAPPGPSPALMADLGEARERVGRDKEAYDVLAPLADKDLMGSAYAYSALSRAARKRGDDARAASARRRCERMAASPSVLPSVCRGEYPKPPLLRGTALGYGLPGLVFVAASALRLVLRRRRPRPWVGFRGLFFGGAIFLGAVLAFLSARNPTFSTVAALTIVFAVHVVERRAFLAAVRRGEMRGFVLRPVEAADAALPETRLFFGPPAGETLDRVTDDAATGYRDNARRPLVRFGRRDARPLLIATVLGAVFVGCGSVLFTTMMLRSSARTAERGVPPPAPHPVPVDPIPVEGREEPLEAAPAR
jgi:hypothetical protein